LAADIPGKTSRYFSEVERRFFMLRPSYSDLIEAVNSEIEPGEQPVVQSRYSIVIAASRRARQLIDGAEPMVGGSYGKKSLSVAVDELYKGKVKIFSEEDSVDENPAEASSLEEAEEMEAMEEAMQTEAKQAAELAENEELGEFLPSAQSLEDAEANEQ
jgi:DNA-directed RNA polymerase subunit omega